MDSVIAARYRTIRRAGRGGMGVVYHARDLASGADVALKVVTVASAAERRRVTREAAVLASLDHPAIVRYLDHGTLPDGDAYLAMEWMSGETLEDRLSAGELGVREAVELAIRVADALGHAHRQGVVHRDLKPSNVILGRQGLLDAKVIDFGVARGSSQSQIVTQAGMIVGTPGYMAPEQARAEADVDARADVFALGCLLFRCLAGRPAYTGRDGVDLLLRVAQGTADALADARPDLPSPILAAVEAMLAPARDDRPSHGLAAAAALRLALESLPPSSSPSGAPAALTGAEQRLVAIVAGTSRDVDVWNDETIREGRSEIGGLRIGDVVSGLGLELEALADRTFLVAITDIEVATDLAARGAQVARALRQADPTLRLAVATGLAIRRGGHTHGRPVDVAAGALASSASPPVARGEIWLDAVTAGLLDGRVPLEATTAGFRLGTAPPSAALVTRRMGAQLPFHGRERELRFLESTFDEALDERAPRAVIVTGEPGIGKSRLVDEAVARIRARTADVTILVASGDVAGKSSPFALVAEAVRRSADVYRDETDEEQLAKLRARVARSVAPARVEEVTFKLAMLVGLDVAPPSRRGGSGGASGPEALHKGDLMRRAFVELVAADAARGPVVVVLEDVQWGDLPSLQAIEALMRRLDEHCAWVVAVGRPEISQLFPGLWQTQGPATLSVVQLAKKPAERLVRAVLSDPSDEVVANIVERGGGNPLFIEQLVRSAHGGAHGTLPETMLAIVALRLEQLGAPARKVLRAASVFGTSAWYDAIRVLLGVDRESPSLRESMDELHAKGLLERRERSRFGDEEEVAFTSAAVREVAYDMLTPVDRTTGHRLAAAWLEQHGESDAVRLGEQWLRAGERSRAAALFGRAAEQALEGGDFVRCRELASLARENETDPELRAAWLSAEAEAFGWAGRFDEMNARAAEALTDLRPGSVAWCRAGAALMLLGGGAVPMERLVQIIGSVAFLPLGDGASLAEVRIHAIVAMLLYRAGQVEMAGLVRDRVLALDPAAFQSESLVRGWCELIRTYEGRFAVRRPHLTFAAAQRAAAHFEEAYDLRLQALALVDAGYAALALGRFDVGVELARRGSEIARAHGADWVNTYGGGVMAGGLARAGRLDEARSLGREMIELSLARRDGVNAAFVAHMLAVGELSRGHVEEAEVMVDRALGDLGLPATTTAYARATKARCELRAGRVDGALALAREARAASEKACPDLAESWIALALVEALEASGDAEGAQRERDRARERLAERMDGMSDEDRTAFLAVPENMAIAGGRA